MVQKTVYSMKLKRRREGKTNYKHRLYLLKSKKARLVIRSQSRQITAQVTNYEAAGDKVVTGATSIELRKLGYTKHTGNNKAAYLTGYLIGKKALKQGVKEAVLDIGLYTPVLGSNVFAALQGAIDAGLDVPHSEDCFPKTLNVEELASVKAAIDKK